jgi:hypothetical protein
MSEKTTLPELPPTRPASWSVDRLPWGELRREAAAGDETLFYMVATASFVEITTDLYTHNLLDRYRDQPPLIEWLVRHWQPEELQHGVALRRYVQAVWPEFPWDEAYASFLTEYAALCNDEALEPTRSGEMAARCIVETGTSSYYTMLRDLSPEPLLRTIAGHIRNDEVGHYKYFYHAFLHYARLEKVPRRATARALWRRIREANGEDAYVAFRHVHAFHARDRSRVEDDYRAFRRRLNDALERHFPYEMAVRMTLKPLELPPWAERASTAVLAPAARRFVSS